MSTKSAQLNFNSHLLNSEKKDRFRIPEMDGFGERKMSKNSKNSNLLGSNKGARSIMSKRSQGTTVNDILARRKESMQQSAGVRRRGGPERSISRAKDGILTVKKFNESDIPEIRHGQQARQKKPAEQNNKNRNGNQNA